MCFTLFLLFALAGTAHADGEQLEKPPKACGQIEQACGEAGYVRGLAKPSDGKDLDKACLQPILKGRAVQGVVVDASIVKSCLDSKKPKATARRRRR